MPDKVSCYGAVNVYGDGTMDISNGIRIAGQLVKPVAFISRSRKGGRRD
jgi:hypothetical protein